MSSQNRNILPNDLCPYCGNSLGSISSEVVDRDHIFCDKFGGRSWIWTHRACNNRFGSEVEGRLQQSGSWIATALHLSGKGGKSLVGPIGKTGHVVEVDMQKRTQRSPKVIGRTGDTYKLSGTREEVKAAIATLAKKGVIADVDAATLLEHAQTLDTGDDMVQANVMLDLKLAARLVAKVTLGAGAKAFGNDFAASTFAATLRQIMNDSAYNPPPGTILPQEFLDQISEQCQSMGLESESLRPSTNKGRVVVVPVVQRSVLAVFFPYGNLVPACFLVDGTPSVGSNMPFVIDDEDRGVSFRLLESEFLDFTKPRVE